MRRRISCGIVVVVILALLAGALGGAWLVGGSSFFGRFVPGLQRDGPPPRTSANKPGPIHAHFTEAELTEQLRKSVRGQGAQNLTLHLEPNLIVISGQLKRGVLSTPFRAELTPFVEAGRIGVSVKKASVGKLPLPTELAQLLGNQAAHALAQQQEKVPGLVIDTLDVRPGAIDVTGHLDPTRLKTAPKPK